jgi:streptogramin lyase
MLLVPGITSVAGTTTQCSSPTATCGDGGFAASANLGEPFGVAVDNAGNLYIADLGDNRVRKVDVTGTITTVAGNGIPCSSPTTNCGDGGPGTSANLNGPRVVAVDSVGNVYIADANDNRIRKLTVNTGVITTIAGNGSSCSPSTANCGDGGAAASASLTPGGLAVDSVGNIYIADGVGIGFARLQRLAS